MPRPPCRRRLVAMLMASVMLLAAGLVPPYASGDAPARACGQGSWIAGTVEFCHGELVYRDYIYDDHGAAFRPLPFGPSSPFGPWDGDPQEFQLDAYGGLPPRGAADWGPGRERDNLADLVSLRLRVTGRRLHVTAELNTMFEAGVTKVVLGIDTDNDPSTRDGDTWPELLANEQALPPLPLTNHGLDLFVTLSEGDPDTNLLAAATPLPDGGRWRLQAVTAEADTGVVRNVAFRGTDETGFWWEDRQADALAQGDIGEFSHTVDVKDLTRRVTRRAAPPPGHVYQRVYISEHNPGPGEGVSHEGIPGPGFQELPPARTFSQRFTMLGRYQPYGFYQPTRSGPHGLQLALHGYTANHSSFIYQPGGQRFTERLGEARNRIIAVPLGRSPFGFYSSYSERDVLDVLADVQAGYDVDATRIFVSGLSMGGYGAMRMAALHPDTFAGVVNWVGFSGDTANDTPFEGRGDDFGSPGGAVGNVRDLLGNIRHIPMAALYSVADPLVQLWTAQAIRDALAEQQVPSIHYLHAGEHLTFNLLDDWRKESEWTAELSLAARPSWFTFRTDERFYFPELGIVPDRAYWVIDIVPAGSGYADVEARSLGCGLEIPVTEMSESTGTDPVPWQAQEITVTATQDEPAANRVELTLANVASLHVLTGDPDVHRQPCLISSPLQYEITTDGPVTVTFSDGRSLTLAEAGAHTGTMAGAGA